MAGFFDFLFGSSDKNKKISNYSPEQEKFFGDFMQMLQGMQGGTNQSMSGLQDWMNPNSNVYKNFEQPYINQFNQEIVPKLAEQFAGFGGGMGGGLSSSGFGQSLGAAGSNLQTNLAQMKSEKSRQSLMDYLNAFSAMTGQGLGASPFSYQKEQGSSGIFGPTLGAIGTGLFGPVGGAVGSVAGSAISNLVRK